MERETEPKETTSEISAGDVGRFLDVAENLDITVWVDGGWGVDALLGEQTRPHSDLDIIVQEKDVAALRAALARAGFQDVETDDRTEWNFVLADDEGHRIDFHVVVLDKDGRGIYGPVKRGVFYPASALQGTGSIAGRAVRCLTPEYQVQSHTGYTIDEDDIRDVMALHERFGVDPPQDYTKN